MKLAFFEVPGNATGPRVGLGWQGRVVDIRQYLHAIGKTPDDAPRTVRGLLERGGDGLAWLRELLHRMDSEPDGAIACSHLAEDIQFLPPIHDAEKFLCVGKNYRAHLEELKRTGLIKESPEEPTGFIKLNACLVGHGSAVTRPATVQRLDYEPELVFVLGKTAFQVTEDQALDHVAGITLLNDLTCRDTQKREVESGSRFWTSKNAPGFGPLGPYVITMDEVPDPYDIWVTCAVNGEERMRVNTRDQIWKIARIIAHFSRLVPLKPGDMFSTGAPGGVAVGKPNSEALFLKPGDVVECKLDNPEMVLQNRIVS